ncbi:uncharacterized protein BJ212DRAFT_1304781 [Suillus subaureus]|uniref:Uncharacterized protein n=1 Tax=Suillus subaureus TaxID=48587 RepID=A0A9P7DTF6_9AGAM|nr:uncharacterized protein BJ212DRAFT_1304781 [Suillus subaureus]KAG1802555.1 hypothetical protein BJ212DRAFT_1304781 [Suillus subaureus]
MIAQLPQLPIRLSGLTEENLFYKESEQEEDPNGPTPAGSEWQIDMMLSVWVEARGVQDYTTIVASQHTTAFFLTYLDLYVLKTSSFFIIKAKLFNPLKHVSQAVSEMKKVLHGALTDGCDWVFLLIKLNVNYDRSSYQHSGILQLDSTRSLNGWLVTAGPWLDLIAAILSHWRYYVVLLASTQDKLPDKLKLAVDSQECLALHLIDPVWLPQRKESYVSYIPMLLEQPKLLECKNGCRDPLGMVPSQSDLPSFERGELHGEEYVQKQQLNAARFQNGTFISGHAEEHWQQVA